MNPCFCMPLQRGCKILALIDAVMNMAALGLMILALIRYSRDDDEDDRRDGIIAVSIFILICILRILLAFRLYYGATNRDLRNCRIWLIITLISTIISIIGLGWNLVAIDILGESIAATSISILYNIYEMIVVYAFIGELKKDRVTHVEVGYITSVPQPQPQSPYGVPPPYFQGNVQTEVYVIPGPESQNSYPMQQYTNNTINQSYPAPVHHVTRT